MDSISIGLWVSGGMLVMVVLGMRVAFAAGMAGFVGLVWLRWNGFDYAPEKFWKAFQISVKVAGLTPHSKVSAQVLSLIPVFILIGYLAYYARLTIALFEAAKRWIAWVPGGLAVSTVFATAGFAAVSGASVATAAVFARIAIPEMLKIGYNKQFAAGVVAAGGTLASLIPPSAILVIYAIIVEQDVGKLLLAGFIPGAFSAVVYAGLIIGIALAIGVNFPNPLMIIPIMGIVILFSLGFSGISVTLAATSKSQETFWGMINLLGMPLFMLSPALFPLELLPNWLAVVAKLNPVTYTVLLVRELMTGVSEGGVETTIFAMEDSAHWR